MEFGDLLRHLRKTKKMTIKELSSKTGIHESQLSRYESNKYAPNYSNLLKLSKVFDIDLLNYSIYKEYINTSLSYDHILEIIGQYHVDSNRKMIYTSEQYNYINSLTDEEFERFKNDLSKYIDFLLYQFKKDKKQI